MKTKNNVGELYVQYPIDKIMLNLDKNILILST